MSECDLKLKEWPCFLEDRNCQKRNDNWTCIHELKCLHIFKQIEKNDFDKNDLFEKLVKELAQDNVFSNIGKEKSSEGSCEYSIEQKIRNINSLSDKKIQKIKIQSRASKTTKKIFERCKGWSVKQLEQKIIKLERRMK